MQTTLITLATGPDLKFCYVFFAGFIEISFRFIFRDLIFQGWGKELNVNQTKLGAITYVNYSLSQSALIQFIIEFPFFMWVIFNLLILNFKSKNGHNSVIIKKRKYSCINLLKSINQYGIKY